MDYATLKALRPSEFEDAADGYQHNSDMASAAKDRINGQILAKMRQNLEGEAAQAAIDQLKALSKNFHYAQVECGLISTALNGFAHDIRAAKKKLTNAVDDAEAEKFTVNSDGTVTYPAAGKGDGEKAAGGTVGGREEPEPSGTPTNPHRASAQEYASRIAKAVKEAMEADAKWSPKLERLRADDDLTVSHGDWNDARKDAGAVRRAAGGYLDTIKDPPKDGSPRDNAAWWKALSQDEKDAYVSLRPASVGAMDGVPAEVRDEANRTVLAETKAKYQIEYAGIPPEPPKYGPGPSTARTQEWLDWNKRKEELEKSLAGMEQIEDRLNKTGIDGLPEAYVLGFSPEGNGRAIIANGNPDTADHTAVFVPGTTANLSSIGGSIEQMNNLWQESDAMNAGKVSTVTWLGYDAPQTVQTDAMFRSYANEAGPTFNQFMDGLDATHDPGVENHRTAVGHSYGTSLIGSAARQGHLNADDVIFAGSPGVQVGDAKDMDVPRGHVWNQEADGDHIPEIGKYFHGEPQGRMNNGTYYVTPSSPLFGAEQVATDTTGHNDYWKEGTQTLKNQAAVVTGSYGSVTREE